MRKNINEETISGRIFEHTLEEKVSKKGIPYVSGDIKVATDEEGLNVITVNFTYIADCYPAKEGQTPKKNKNYPIVKNIIANGKTWAKDGKDAALKIQIKGAIGVNNFVSKDGTMIAAMRNEGSFINIISELPQPEKKKTNDFNVDIIINRVTSMEDADGNDLGYDEVGGRIFTYQGLAIPVTFIVKRRDGRDYFESLDASNSNLIYTNVSGKIESLTKTTQKVIESAFGEPTVIPTTTTVKAWVIDRSNPTTFELDSPDTMTVEDVKRAVQAYEIHLAEVQKNHDEYIAGQASGSATPSNTTAPAPAPAQKAQFAGF